MAMSNVEVGSRIRSARCLKGISQAQLSGAVGCSAPHISQIENGDTSARVCQIVLASGYLGVDPRSITTGIPVGVLELAETLIPITQDRGSVGHAAELTKLAKCFLGKPLPQQQKILATWKAVLEMV